MQVGTGGDAGTAVWLSNGAPMVLGRSTRVLVSISFLPRVTSFPPEAVRKLLNLVVRPVIRSSRNKRVSVLRANGQGRSDVLCCDVDHERARRAAFLRIGGGKWSATGSVMRKGRVIADAMTENATEVGTSPVQRAGS